MDWYSFPRLGFNQDVENCEPMSFYFRLDTDREILKTHGYEVAVLGDVVFLEVSTEEDEDKGYFRPSKQTLSRFHRAVSDCRLSEWKRHYFLPRLDKFKWHIACRTSHGLYQSSGNVYPDRFDQLADAVATLIGDRRLRKAAQPSKQKNSRTRRGLLRNRRALKPIPDLFRTSYQYHSLNRFDCYENFHFGFSIGSEHRDFGFELYAWDGFLLRNGVTWIADPAFRFISEREVNSVLKKLRALNVLSMRPFYEIAALHGTSWIFSMKHEGKILQWKGYTGAPVQFYDICAVIEDLAEAKGLYQRAARALSAMVELQVTLNGKPLK
jgi:hypothetical protein